MYKKLFLMITLLVIPLLLLSACNNETELAVPSDFRIEGNQIYFTEVSQAVKYRIELISENDNSIVIRRTISQGEDMNTLNIPEGYYTVKLQAVGDGKKIKDSAFTSSLTYRQIDLNAVKLIEEEGLVDDLYIKWMGRTLYNETTKVNMMYHSASGFEVHFKGTTVNATITATNTSIWYWRPYIVIVLDDDFDNAKTVVLEEPSTNLVLVENLADDNQEHKLSIYKRSESIDSHIGLKSITTDGKFIQKVEYRDRKIEVIAASGSTGFGNLGTVNDNKTTANSDSLKAYAFLTAQALNADINIVAASGWGVKASRWTTPNTLNMFDAYKKVDVFSTVSWDFSKFIPDVVVINLGTNDWSYITATDDPNEQNARIQAFINQYVNLIIYVNGMYPNAEIIILYGIMNEINVYTHTETIFQEASKTVDNLSILKVHGDAKGCSYHPSASSHETIAIALTNKIKQIKNW